MAVTKWYEIVCDACHCGQHYQGSIKIAEAQFKDEGGIIIDGKHFCNVDCYPENQRGE